VDRIFVIGNGGSGKTWLTEKLSTGLRVPSTHLDDLHWLPNFEGERLREERDRLVQEAANGAVWIMEGIYGSVFQQISARVTTLIWLDLPVEECLSNLMQRGQAGGGTDEQFDDLLAYTRAYHDRQNLNSYAGHLRLFNDFRLEKFRLSSRSDCASFLSGVKAAHRQ
jgi:adenylate kinase family enzyme